MNAEYLTDTIDLIKQIYNRADLVTNNRGEKFVIKFYENSLHFYLPSDIIHFDINYDSITEIKKNGIWNWVIIWKEEYLTMEENLIFYSRFGSAPYEFPFS